MIIAVPAERSPERRVSLVPGSREEHLRLGAPCGIQAGAGASAKIPDRAFSDAGAQISDDVWSADVLLKVAPPSADEVGRSHRGQAYVGFLDPLGNPDGVSRLAEAGVIAFAVELIPRISRAQSMDALTSQADVAGYRAVLVGCNVRYQSHAGVRITGRPLQLWQYYSSARVQDVCASVVLAARCCVYLNHAPALER